MIKQWFQQWFRRARHRFHGGIHVPSHKSQSTQQPSHAVPLLENYALSLVQQDGKPFIAQVTVGDYVLRGQCLAEPSSNRDVPLHAPTSGTIVALQPVANMHPSNQAVPHLILHSDGRDAAVPAWPALDETTPPAELLARIAAAGIVGLGGAGFPTARKLQHHSKTLVINAAECEPYITCDDLQIRECAPQIVRGAQITAAILHAERILFGIEDDKPAAIDALQHAITAAGDPRISVQSVPVRYPSGNARQLFELLLGIRVPADRHASDFGLICHNSGTMKAVHDAVILGRPLTERYTTVTGEGIRHPQVWRMRIGTPAAELIALSGGENGTNRHIIGGPMMGYEIHDLATPLQKTGNCLLLLPATPAPQENPCIRCARCADACPMELLPQQLLWYSQSAEQKRLEQYRLFDCIECGICAAVCPSDIPLVQYYRHSKDHIRAERAKKAAAEHARERHNARQARLAREAAERQAQMEARRAKLQQMAKPQPADNPPAPNSAAPAVHQLPSDDRKQSAIEAAKARAAAKRAARLAENNPVQSAEPVADDKKAAIEAAKARAAAKCAARLAENNPVPPVQPVADDKKAAIEAAKARAAARRTARLAENNPVPPVQPAEDDKKAAIEAAKARAAAKRAARLAENNPAPPAQPAADDKKAAIEAAKARAAAKRAARLAENNPVPPAQPAADDKKAAIEAAKARATAKRAARLAENNPVPPVQPVADDKKAAIEAAKARAAAKRAARLAENNPAPPVQPVADDKKAAIEAAKARAAAKRAARLAGQDSSSHNNNDCSS